MSIRLHRNEAGVRRSVCRGGKKNARLHDSDALIRSFDANHDGGRKFGGVSALLNVRDGSFMIKLIRENETDSRSQDQGENSYHESQVSGRKRVRRIINLLYGCAALLARQT